jgi:hypothetical protein
MRLCPDPKSTRWEADGLGHTGKNAPTRSVCRTCDAVSQITSPDSIERAQQNEKV